ncbi:Putative nucleus export protein Brl1/Brr6 [Septoria linicola]|uniref:Nucleus export protein Brl1/Brr6 n=1 Tax=Septoria linicola TaxID=215465 RepID=A0A9Q9EL13_9PEZI|nr:putative nucleus export protein Brl1/Brr6 [Septoria linicola]USW55351.1 Putative nucleus export protein Brl1/Brr6 [Septoria linicola]
MSRGNEMGMDFEYQNKTGPLDARSPFAQLSQNAQRFGASTPSKQRGNNAFNSPFKKTTALQSPTRKPLPPVPAFNALYNTPRSTRNTDYDDSSAGETPKSPERSDNDATPDHSRLGLRGAVNNHEASSLPTMPGAERNSPTKEKARPETLRRDSWLGTSWGKIKNKLNSPGRGEIHRPEHSGAIEKRVKKRRERELQRHVSKRRRHSISDSGEDSELPAKGSRKTSSKHKKDDAHSSSERQPHWLSRTFTFIAQHPTVPHILSFYAQLMFNIFLLAGCIYLIYCFWSAVQGDVDKKSHEAMADIMAEMAECARQYTTNNCDPAIRVPALTNVCEGWSKCMNRDASKVGRAKVSAHTFAEIFNSFVEPISWKAMAFTFLLVFGCFASGNLAFGFFRDKTNQGGGYQPNYYQQPPPPTPQRTFSGQNQQYFGTPWQTFEQLEPGPSGYPGQQMIEGGENRSPQRSPVRRLVYN